jgi:decaprenylphospho-beta-D-ribofuranose 2-oxidase
MNPVPQLRLVDSDSPKADNSQVASTPPNLHTIALPIDHLERVSSWGMSSSGMSYVYRPSTVDGVLEVFDLARQKGLKVGLRGAGRSYGDASTLSEQICLDLTRLSRILEWDPDTGIIRCEPGVTIKQIWQYAIEDGWWPYVVPGTMYPTIGGCAAMNIHGKNNWKVGPIGDHILEFDLLLPTGEVKRCSRAENPELFHAAIGGFGMLGCFLSITMELKRVNSGMLEVEPVIVSSLGEMIREFEESLEAADYLVGWIDCFARGDSLGRGLIHQANYLTQGQDANPIQSLRVENQVLPDSFFNGLLPKSAMWRILKYFVNNAAMSRINAMKYWSADRHSGQKYRQSHAAFAFLLDYVPNWKWAYKPGGLIQYQSFIPAEQAERVFAAQISLAQHHGLPPYLGVFKRHKSDDFLMTHAVDGYSLALDFKVTKRNRTALWELATDMDKMVVEAGGRFYFAKDSTLSPESLRDYLQEEQVQKFLKLKRECDPEGMLETDLFRRVFGRAERQKQIPHNVGSE